MPMRKTLSVFFIILIIYVFVSGCTKVNIHSSGSIPDPEEGVENFVDAVNQKDANKLFNLYSEESKANLSVDYLYNSLHEGPGPIIINYTVLDKEIKGNKAWINVRFVAELPDPDGEIKPTPYNSRMVFILEDNQWRMSDLWLPSDLLNPIALVFKLISPAFQILSCIAGRALKGIAHHELFIPEYSLSLTQLRRKKEEDYP